MRYENSFYMLFFKYFLYHQKAQSEMKCNFVDEPVQAALDFVPLN